MCEPLINKMLDICTSHMTEEDADYLKSDPHEFASYDLTYGWLVYCHKDSPESFEVMSDAFKGIIKWALELECDYVRFDNDGRVYDHLERFDW